MKIKVTFMSEAYFEGKNLIDAVQKAREINLLSEDACKMHGAKIIEVSSVHNADTGKDVTELYDEIP